MASVTGLMPTMFAPAERFPPEQVAQQAQYFLDVSPTARFMLDAIPDILMVLNSARQIIFANRSLLDLLGQEEPGLLGRRPGEALDCIHAFDEVGCGTTEFCRTCGAVRAILNSQAGQPDEQECRITRRSTGEALDLRVRATPFRAGDQVFTIFVLTDISHEKRRRALEHIFFHDILNTVTALRASADILRRAEPQERAELTEMLRRLVKRLIEEIMAQRELVDAENDELVVDPALVNAADLVRELAEVYGHHDAARGRLLQLVAPEDDLRLVSDPVLLRRVIGNMLKNALEASRPGETVTLGCAARGGGVEFWVHNVAAMPRDVQLQVFQRSFSTKGAGRGLGTYSMKLLSERYLGGCVRFSTSPDEGTTFRAWYPLRLTGD